MKHTSDIGALLQKCPATTCAYNTQILKWCCHRKEQHHVRNNTFEKTPWFSCHYDSQISFSVLKVYTQHLPPSKVLRYYITVVDGKEPPNSGHFYSVTKLGSHPAFWEGILNWDTPAAYIETASSLWLLVSCQASRSSLLATNNSTNNSNFIVSVKSLVVAVVGSVFY